MGKAIKDEFTDRPISRQRKYQLRMQRDRRCMICGQPAAESGRCVRHLVLLRERLRRTLGSRRRYKNAMSYRLERKG